MVMNSYTPHHAALRDADPRTSALARATALSALSLLLSIAVGCEDPKPPVVELSASEPLALGVPITILNQGAGDGEGVSWSLSAKPPASQARLLEIDDRSGEEKRLLTPDVLGRYEVTATERLDELTVTDKLELIITCTPPAWQLTAELIHGEQGPVGQAVNMVATLSAETEEGCPELEPLDPTVTWALLSKPNSSEVSLTPIGERARSFTPDSAGSYLIRAAVSDEMGRQSAQELRYLAECGDAAPIVEASASFNEGPSEEGAWVVGQPLSLSMSAEDPDLACNLDQPLTVAWRLTERPAQSGAQVSPADGTAPWFTPDVPGVYVAEVSATDPQGNTGSASVRVEVSECGDAPPVIGAVEASPAPSLLNPSQLSVTWTDADQDEACASISAEERHEVLWSVISAPSASRALPLPVSAQRPSFAPDFPGDYTLKVEVTDRAGHAASAELSFSVDSCGSAAPSVTLSSSAERVALGSPLTIQASPADPDEACGADDEVSLSWRVLSAPAGAPSLPLPSPGPDALALSTTFSVAGVYLLEVSPVDRAGHVGPSAQVSVEALDCGALPPSIDQLIISQGEVEERADVTGAGALPQLSASLNAVARFTASTSDPNEACLEALNLPPSTARSFDYQWQVERAPQGSQTSATEARDPSLELSFDLPGSYELSLRVSDERNSAEVRFSVTVNSCGIASPTISWLDPIGGALTAPGVGQPLTLSVSAQDADEAPGCELPQPLSYQWRWRATPAGSGAELRAAQTSAAWFTPDVPGVYLAEVTVTDPEGHSAQAQATVTVEGCGAYPPEIIELSALSSPGLAEPQVGSPLRLAVEWADQDLTQCASGDTHSFNWRLVNAPNGSQVSLNLPDSAQPWFSPDLPGAYQWELTIRDAQGLTATGRVTVEVSGCGAARPSAELSLPSGPLAVGVSALLEVVVSDPDEQCAPDAEHSYRYDWRVTSLPAGASAPFTPEDRPSLTWRADLAGDYELSVTVTDATGRVSAPATGVVTVSPCGGLSPELSNLRLDGALTVGGAARLLADVSDPNLSCGQGGSLSYQWQLLSRPEGSTASLSQGGAQATPSLTFDRAGTYTAELRVSSSVGTEASDSFSWEVSSCGGASPVASAELSPSNPSVGSLVQLIGSATDADSDLACGDQVSLSYRWEVAELPQGYSDPLQLTGSSPWLNVTHPGLYRFTLTVEDEDGNRSDPVSVSFTVEDCGATPPSIDLQSLSLSPASPQVDEPAQLSAVTLDPDAACGGVTAARVVWRVLSTPSDATLSVGAGSSPQVIASARGAYTVEATPIGADGLEGSPERFSFEVGPCGGFTPSLSLSVSRAELPELTVTSATLGAEPVTLIAYAATLDADEVAPCALSQGRSVRWWVSAAPQGAPPELSPATSRPDERAQGSAVSFSASAIGEYKLTAEVTDATGRSSQAETSFTLTSCGQAQPQLGAITVSPTLARVGQPVSFSSPLTPADASCEQAEPSSYTWQWRLLSRPSESAATLRDDKLERPTLTPDVPGAYALSAQARSPLGVFSEEQTFTLSVPDCGGRAPLITSAPSAPATVNLGVPLSFSVQGLDPDQDCGAASAWRASWRLVSAPIGSGAALDQEASPQTSLTPDLEGSYTLEVKLIELDPQPSGERLESEPARVSFTAGSCGGEAPQALISASAPVPSAAGEDITVSSFGCAEAPFIQLDGAQSFDPNAACGLAEPLSYSWEVVEVSAGLEVALSNPRAASLNLAISGVPEGSSATLKVKLTTTNSAGLEDVALATVNVSTLFAPQAASINPSFLCDQAQTITVSGDHFYTYGDALPRLFIAGLQISADSVAGCAPVANTGGLIGRCSGVTFSLPGGLSADLYNATLRNPYPLGCDDQTPPQLFVVSAPSIDSFSPRPICRGQFDGRLTLAGSGFVRDQVNAQEVVITVNGEAALSPSLALCELANASLELCSEASFEIPVAQRDIAELDVSLSNPNPGGCDPQTLTTVQRFIQSEPPQIDEVIPSKICDQGGQLNLIGQYLEEGITVSLAGQLADSVTAVNGELEVAAVWTEQPTPRFAPGIYDLIATNPTNCSTTLPQEIRITEGPVPFFVDPPIVYNGITLQATAYLGNLFGGSVTRVEVSHGTEAPIDLDFAFDPATPSQLKIFIPQGVPVGLYDLTLYDDVNCPGTTEGLLTVTDQLTANITELTPPFAWINSVTPVVAFAQEGAGFVPTPRAYLTPSFGDECVDEAACVGAELCVNGRCSQSCVSTADCDPGLACVGGACAAQAAELRATSIRSETELQGAVDQGFAPGLYDLVVVNPDGSVGLLNQAMKVNVDPPPIIKAVSPGSWEVNDSALPVQIIGTGFSDGASATATCVTGNTTDSFALTVNDVQPELINVTVNTTLITAASICSVRVFNADASYDDFSPLTGTNPSGNFVSFSEGPALPAGAERRLPSVTYAEIPNGGPALFLMGGDTADGQTLLDMFTARIDPFGALGAWEPLATTLPYGLTATQAVTLGRFIYILGGRQNGGVDSLDILRAELLDPLYVPEVNEVDFEFDPAINGLDTGVYYYRISALYDVNDPNNPGGESLPSEPQPVFIPQIPGVGVRLILQWDGLPDAVAYRVYRSPTPDLLLGQEEVIAELPATELSFTDDGSLNTTPNTSTLNQGILGNWVVVDQLNVARSSHSVVIAPDPVTQDLHHIYAIGGLIGGGATDSYEYISVDVSVERDHLISAPTLVNGALNQPRSRLGALTGTPQVASYLSSGADPKSAVIYVMGGEGSKNVEVGEVLPGGSINAFTVTGGINNTKAGYATAIANNNLVIVGGHNGGASTKADKGVICGIDCAPGVEEVQGWSSLGNVGVRSTVDAGYSSAKGFFYVVAGGDGTSDISTKVDVALLGGTP